MSNGYEAYLATYVPVGILLVAGLCLVAAMLTGNRLLRPTSPTRQGIFVGVLAVGLAYAWRKGVLAWT